MEHLRQSSFRKASMLELKKTTIKTEVSKQEKEFVAENY